jgi:hypothetical protein
MADVNDVNKLQDQIFDLVKRSQDTMVDASRAFTDRVSALTPGDSNQIDELIDSAFDMTERVLQSQREFAKRMVETVTSQLPGIDRGSADD